MGSGRTNLGGGYVKVSYNITSITGVPLTRINPTALSVARYDPAGASVGNYAIFAGGKNSSNVQVSTVDAYDNFLVRTTPTTLSFSPQEHASATVGSYALFAGGNVGTSSVVSTSIVNAYDSSLVRSTPTALSVARFGLAGASVGSFAIFAGGWTTNNNIDSSTVVDAYNSSLVRSTPTALSVARRRLAGASNNSNAIFAGGTNSSGVNVNTIDSYNSSLVRSTSSTLSVSAEGGASASFSTKAYFAYGDTGSANTAIDTFDTSMARTTIYGGYRRKNLLSTRNCGTGNYAFFGGGQLDGVGGYNRIVEAIEVSSNTITEETGFSVARVLHASATVNGWILFAGGIGNAGTLSSVEAYAPAIKINLPAGSKHQFSPATSETTVVSQTTITIPAPVSGYVKFKKGTVTAI